jgi:uncharacterized protein
LTLSVPSSQTFVVYLRIPAWAEGATVRVNGRGARSSAQPGTFAAVRREWRGGDRIELELPLPLRLQRVDDQHRDTVALLAGPLALMRLVDGPSSEPPPFTRDDLLAAQRQTPQAHEWQLELRGRTVKLRPFADIGSERYSLYQDVREARADGALA